MSLQFRGRKTTTRPTQHEVRQLVVEIWRAWDSHHQRARDHERPTADHEDRACALDIRLGDPGRPSLLRLGLNDLDGDLPRTRSLAGDEG